MIFQAGTRSGISKIACCLLLPLRRQYLSYYYCQRPDPGLSQCHGHGDPVVSCFLFLFIEHRPRFVEKSGPVGQHLQMRHVTKSKTICQLRNKDMHEIIEKYAIPNNHRSRERGREIHSFIHSFNQRERERKREKEREREREREREKEREKERERDDLIRNQLSLGMHLDTLASTPSQCWIQ
jgi:hypothetical protein